MISRINKKVIISFLILILLPSAGFAITSDVLNLQDEINSKKTHLNKLETKLESYKKKIDEARSQSVTLKNQIELINNHVSKTELEIEETETRIAQLELEMIELNQNIADIESKITLQKSLIAHYLRELQKQGNKSPLEIILLNKTFSRFFSELRYLEQIQTNLKDSTKNLEDFRKEMQDNRQDLEEKKSAALKLKYELEDRKGRLEAQKTAKTFLIGQTFASEGKFQALLREAQEEQEALDAELSRLESEVRKKLEQSDLFPFNGEIVLTWPVPKNRITTYFHDSEYPFRYLFEHSGLDIRAGQGTAIKSPAPGYVLKVRNQNSWRTYNYIVLVHSGGVSTIYLHLSDVYVQPDTYVSRGQVIGATGGTPRTRGAGIFTTGPHLHFEVRQNGIPVNPLNYLVDL